MALNLTNIGRDMLGAAAKTAGAEWAKIKGVAINEIGQLARTIVDTANAVKAGELKPTTARIVLTQSKNLTIALLAALAAIGAAAIRKIVNAALNVVKAAVNAFAGVALL